MQVSVHEKREFSKKIIDLVSPSVLVCKKQLGIRTFGYRRFLQNGKSFGFSDNTVWNEISLERFSGIRIPEYEKDLQRYIESGEESSMREGIPDPKSTLFNALYETNIWNTLSLYLKSPNNAFVEAFYFAATRDDIDIHKAYKDKLDFIHEWVKLIQFQLVDLFSEKSGSYFSNTIMDPNFLDTLHLFLSSKNLEIPQNVLMSLSEREWEIVVLLAKGFKRRHIAHRLDIAPKTVDSYLEHIKNKTNTTSKIQFLKFLKGKNAREVLEYYESNHFSK